MRDTLFHRAWLFIIVVAAFDSWFAWVNRKTMIEWEANPLQVYLLQSLGIWSCLIFRSVTLTFLVATVYEAKDEHPETAQIATSIMFVVHVFLLWLYVCVYWNNP